MVVYLDVLFAVNALMDGATLLAAARLGGVQVRKMRLIFSAALGGGYAVLGAVWPVLTLAPLRLLAGLGLCMIAFGRERQHRRRDGRSGTSPARSRARGCGPHFVQQQRQEHSCRQAHGRGSRLCEYRPAAQRRAYST